MADYTKAELLNEVSKVFRAGLSPGRSGGTLNTATEYQQLLEMASVTFLFNPDAVFYIARLAANQLTTIVNQEVAVLEDILVALDDLGQIGAPVRDTATLSNARTAVLSLDAAESVSNRPETARFMRHMDTFAEQLRKNLVSQEKSGAFVRPREEARDLVQSNLTRLDTLHTRLLTRVFSLQEVLQDFLSLDLPSIVSATALSSVSSRLQSAIDEVGDSSDTDNVAASRRLFLETLANKISVKILSTFADPTEFKYRSPIRPIPATLRHLGQVTGQGAPASVLTSAGPWDLPVSAPLVLKVSGGSPVTLNLDDIKGSLLSARNSQNYEIQTGARDLHVVLDSALREDTAAFGGTTYVGTSTFMRLGFKHLGCPVSLPDSDTGINPNDIHTRFILDHRDLQTATAPNCSYLAPVLTVTAFVAADEGAIGFQSGHVGAYILDSVSNRFEIIRVISSSQVELDTRGLTPNFTSGMTLRGQLASGVGNTVFSFLPAVTTAPVAGDRVQIGPAVKTARLTVGSRTAANIIADIQAETGVFDGADDGAKLNWHVSPELVPGDNSRVCLRIRSKLDPSIQITSRFIRPRNPVGLVLIESGSAHQVLGYYEGEQDTDDTLSTSELAALISTQSGMSAEVVTTEIQTGTLETVPLLARVSDPTANFTALALPSNTQIEISDGTQAGTYRVLSTISATVLELDRPAFSAKESDLAYRIFKEQVSIGITSAGPGTSLEVVSAPTELGLSVGTVYSSIPTFEAVDKLGNKLTFSSVVPGDLLRVLGQDEVVISEVQNDGELLVLETGLPSNTSKIGFEVRSAAARAFKAFNALLTTFVSSRNLLKKNSFDEGVDAIDNACTAAILPGQNFVSSRNQAKRMVSELLSILSSELLREDEYDTNVVSNPNNLKDLLDSYEAATIEEVNNLLEALLDRKYDRAADLLRSGKFTDLYATTEETASYGGAVMSASRNVVKDLPQTSRTRFDFLNKRDIAKSSQTLTDGESDFSDTENESGDADL